MSTVSTTMRKHNKVPLLAAVCGGQGLMEVGLSTDGCLSFLVNCCRFVWGETEETVSSTPNYYKVISCLFSVRCQDGSEWLSLSWPSG